MTSRMQGWAQTGDKRPDLFGNGDGTSQNALCQQRPSGSRKTFLEEPKRDHLERLICVPENHAGALAPRRGMGFQKSTSDIKSISRTNRTERRENETFQFGGRPLSNVVRREELGERWYRSRRIRFPQAPPL